MGKNYPTLKLQTAAAKDVYVSILEGLFQTRQPLVKESLETHEKKFGDPTKNSEILFLTRSKTFSIDGSH